MTKLLLATTALVASTSFATAGGHMVWSGSAKAGIALTDGTTGDNDGDVHVYSQAAATLTMSGSSDNGLDFGASLSFDAGNDYDTGDFEFDGVEDGHVSFGNIWITSGGLTVTFDDGGTDDLYNDDNSHDIHVGYTTGGISFAMTHDVDGDNTGTTTTSNSSGSSYSIAYSGGAISASLAGNDSDGLVINVGYTTGDLSFGLEHDSDENGVETNTASVGYTSGAVSIDASVADDDTWDVSVGYSEGNVSVSVSTDENDAWELVGSMDAGGGLSLHAGINASSDYYLGAAMSF